MADVNLDTYNPTLLRSCIGCGGVDNHPRHSIEVQPGVDVHWHMDCHAIATGCELCLAARGGVEASVIGNEFRKHIVAQVAAHQED